MKLGEDSYEEEKTYILTKGTTLQCICEVNALEHHHHNGQFGKLSIWGAKMGNHLDWMLHISYLFLISHNRMVAEKGGQLVKIGSWLQACNILEMLTNKIPILG